MTPPPAALRQLSGTVTGTVTGTVSSTVTSKGTSRARLLVGPADPWVPRPSATEDGRGLGTARMAEPTAVRWRSGRGPVPRVGRAHHDHVVAV